MLLVDGLGADLWREADDVEKAAWYRNPPAPVDTSDPAVALFVRLWEAACVVRGWNANRTKSYGRFNRTTGYFELNGILDITLEEALAIWTAGRIRTNVANRFYYGADIRTNLPPSMAGAGGSNPSNLQAQDIVAMGRMEVLNLANSGEDVKFTLSAGTWRMFNNATGLRRVIGRLSLTHLPKDAAPFNAAPALEEIRFAECNRDLSLSALGRLSPESVGSLAFQQLAPQTPKTVTLHPDVYARLTRDTTNAACAALTEDERQRWAAALDGCTAAGIIFTPAA